MTMEQLLWPSRFLLLFFLDGFGGFLCIAKAALLAWPVAGLGALVLFIVSSSSSGADLADEQVLAVAHDFNDRTLNWATV
ncbi:hypothetical protein PAPYR_10443 [Paratrimastix pyriformis]|uniref:Uncharacterized protein n=1 Tax=Paratrimastix pyriformis TaxID=342808 RepID=A0ABQ8UA45_9EUKA|nr:hypothetical protein PAPYR_10443 [Paratrimastix pyriformis]